MTNRVVEEISSHGGAWRARLLERDDGFEVVVERQIPGDGDLEPPYWSRVGTRVILVDTLERARIVAREELAATA